MNDLLEKLEAIYHRWLEIADEIAKPDVMSDMKRYIKLNKDYKDLQAVVDAYKSYKNITENIINTKEILATEKDEDFREMAKSELDHFLEQRDTMEEEIRLLLLP
ncbi:MAG: PCRF domain-containing protein, partial [Bacteroidales bacterium]